MRTVAAVSFLLIVLVSPVRADVTYTVTLTDEQDEAVQEQTRLINLEAGKRFKGTIQTPADLVSNAVRSLVRTWEASHVDSVAHKDWATRTSREKRISCKQLKIAASDCPR